MLLDKVNNVETHTFAALVLIRKEEPFVIASCVCIILQNEIILVLFAIKTFICVEQIPAFEFGVENVLVLFLEVYLLIICWIMICCVIQRKYIACV